MPKNKINNMVTNNEISFLKSHLGASKQDIIKAVATVGNKLERIELYLRQQGVIKQDRAKPNR